MITSLVPLLLACTDPVATRTPPGSTSTPTDLAGDTAAPEDTGSPGDTAAPTDPAPEVPGHLALPYAVVGDPAPEAELVTEGDLGAVSGPFAVDGHVVRFTGGTGTPTLASGELVVTVAGAEHVVTLAAVIGDPELPGATWSTDTFGARAVLHLASAPFPADSGGAWSDDSVLVVVPPGLGATGPLHTVTHLHGHYATLLDTVAAQWIVEQHALSGRDAVLIVPQGPLEAASGDFGQLMDAGGHARLLRDVVAVLYRDGLVVDARLGQQVLTAHSGGYVATAAIARDGAVDAIHLFDGLYGESATFEDFALGGGVLRSSGTSYGGTLANNEALAARLEGQVPLTATFDDAALASVDVAVGWSPSSHDGEVADRRNYARWLVESGLPPRRPAPPELLLATPDRVAWRLDRGAPRRVVVVEGSDDGLTWRELGRGDDGGLQVAATAWVRLVALTGGIRSAPSDAAAATGARWLVVDGFDRVLGGSWSSPTHDFAARVGVALPVGCSSASNEAVVQGLVDPLVYDGVLWLLGDESLADDTFDEAERSVLDELASAGIPVIVSGSEVGYASRFDVLGARYVADDAGTDRAGGYTFGVTYPEDYPDVLAGGATVWTYDTGGAAAVATTAGVVVGFPLETLVDADLGPALAELFAALP